jgi:glycosyltransferase involved in cell wall biosynthesis
VVEQNGAGGLVHYAYQLCTALATRGVDVTLVTADRYELEGLPHNFRVERRLRLWPLFDPSSGESRRGLAGALRALRWRLRRARRGIRLVVEWARLVRYLLRQRPDVVQFGKINFPFEAIFLRRLRRHGLVLTQICHEFELRERDRGPLDALTRRLYRPVYSAFSAIVLHSAHNRQRFLTLYGVPPGRTWLVPYGNQALFEILSQGAGGSDPMRARYAIPDEAPVILFFGVLAPSKGLPTLLDAFALVRRECQARLLIAGFPSKHIDMAALRRQAEALGVADAVTFDTRYVPADEVGPLMKHAHCVVLPYRNGSESAVLQLAYTFGRPVVATAVGGLPEAVEDGASGILVPPDAPAALAAACLRLLRDPALARRMGDRGRHLAETRHSWDAVADALVRLYEGLGRQVAVR